VVLVEVIEVALNEAGTLHGGGEAASVVKVLDEE
jgi:hypothetical protein